MGTAAIVVSVGNGVRGAGGEIRVSKEWQSRARDAGVVALPEPPETVACRYGGQIRDVLAARVLRPDLGYGVGVAVCVDVAGRDANVVDESTCHGHMFVNRHVPGEVDIATEVAIVSRADLRGKG